MDTRGVVKSLFEVPRALIGTIHVGALPGTPGNKKSVAAIAEDAAREARVYETSGFQGLAIENTHDRPYLKGSVGPEIGAAMEFFQANGVIVSGVATGAPADAGEVQAVSEAVSIPTLIGSGITPENIGEYAAASAFIVGSSVKEDGKWENRLEETRVRALVRAFAKNR